MAERSFLDLLRVEFRWPTKGDSLFREADHWSDNATLPHDSLTRLVLMADGYKRAADLLVDHAVTQRSDRDVLVYPIIYDYRHFLELSLKYLLLMYGQPAGVAVSWKTHDLKSLWLSFIKMMHTYAGDTADLDAESIVGDCVLEFARIDPGSDYFRYPVSTQGTPIEIRFESLDLARLKDVIEGIGGYFDGTDGLLSQYDLGDLY